MNSWVDEPVGNTPAPLPIKLPTNAQTSVPTAAQNSAPTLTEVVEAWESGPTPLDAPRSESEVMTASFRGRWDASTGAAVASIEAAQALSESALAPAPTASRPSALNEDQIDQRAIVQQVMLDLQRHIDLMLEHRLREALMPVLARATDALVLEARNELASTLLSVVQLAVSRSVSKAMTQAVPDEMARRHKQ